MSKKEKLPETINKLKDQLEKENNLVDYFLVCGVHPSICQDQSLYECLEGKNDKFKKLTPEIISKCPPFEKSTIRIDQGILSYCFPNDFKIIYSKKQPEPKEFSFILDNQFYSFEYPQKFVTCILFYESLLKYQKLQKKFESLNQYSTLTHSESTIELPETIDSNMSMLIDNSSVLTTETSSTSISTVRSQNIKQLQLEKPNNYYIPKCICIVSVYPYITWYSTILKSFYEYSNNSVGIPIEKIVLNLIIEVPAPPRGLYSIEYFVVNRKLLLKQNEMNKLPLVNFPMEIIWEKFNFNQIAEIFKHILFETKVIFFSKNTNSICYSILSFLTLIYPLKYPFQIASIINKENYGLIESISPYIFGIKGEYTETFFKENEIETSQIEILCVDIDNNHVILKDNGQSFPKFPKKMLNQFQKGYNNFIKFLKLDKGDKIIIGTNRKNELYSEFADIFFNLMISILKNYQKYLNYNYYTSTENLQNTNINTLFKVQDFINLYSGSEKEFFTKFVNDSQMFSEFIYKRMIPKNIQQKTDLLFFNEKIAEYNNKNQYFPKKEKYTLLNSKDYNFNNNYFVPKQNELSQNENYFLSSTPQSVYLKKGQVIQKKKIDGKYCFNYYIFPEFLYEVFFNSETVLNYLPFLGFQEEIEAINIDIFSKSKSNFDSEKSNGIEMLNFIYLSWLEIWAFSFKYTRKNEREFRFNQMLFVLNKVIHHEMQIFNLLFEALSQEKEEEMILELYTIFISYKLNPSIFIHTILSKILDSKSIQSMKLSKTERVARVSTKDKKELMLPKKSFSKRTFKIKCENVLLGENVKFNSYFACFECGEKSDLLSISKDYSHMKRDTLWAKCKNCESYFLPKLKIIFGKEVNRENTQSEIYGKTSTVDEVVLYSPHDLKANLKEGIYREYGINLNIDIFKLKFTALFWNCIWYFSINELPYDFFLPYEENYKTQNVKEILNKRNNCTLDIYLNGGIFDILLKAANKDNNESNGNKVFKVQLRSKVKVSGASSNKNSNKSFGDLEITHEDSYSTNETKTQFIFSSRNSLFQSEISSRMNESFYVNGSNILENSFNFDTDSRSTESYYTETKRGSLFHLPLSAIQEDEKEYYYSRKAAQKKKSSIEFNTEELYSKLNINQNFRKKSIMTMNRKQRAKSLGNKSRGIFFWEFLLEKNNYRKSSHDEVEVLINFTEN